jgi:hypothetical protein
MPGSAVMSAHHTADVAASIRMMRRHGFKKIQNFFKTRLAAAANGFA